MTARDPVRVVAEAGALDVVVDPALIAPEGWRSLDLTRLGGVTIGGARISARFAAIPAVAGGAEPQPRLQRRVLRRAALAEAAALVDAAPDLVEAPISGFPGASEDDPIASGAAFVGLPPEPPHADHPAYAPQRVDPIPVPPPIDWQRMGSGRRGERLDRSAFKLIIAGMVLAWVAVIGVVLYAGNEPSSGARMTSRRS